MVTIFFSFLYSLTLLSHASGLPHCVGHLAVPDFETTFSALKDGSLLEITLVTEQDAEEIVSFLNTVAGESANLSFGAEELGRSVAEQAAQIQLNRDDDQIFIKGYRENEIVALASLDRSSIRPRLRHVGEFSISVRKAQWRLGIAKQIMRRALVHSQAMQMQKVSLRVVEDNLAAIQLYQSLGFKTEGILKKGLMINGVFKNLIIMSWFAD